MIRYISNDIIFYKGCAGTFLIRFVSNCYCVITQRYCLIIQYICPHSRIFRRADHPTIIGVDVDIGAVHQHKVSNINEHTCFLYCLYVVRRAFIFDLRNEKWNKNNTHLYIISKSFMENYFSAWRISDMLPSFKSNIIGVFQFFVLKWR